MLKDLRPLRLVCSDDESVCGKGRSFNMQVIFRPSQGFISPDAFESPTYMCTASVWSGKHD